MSIRTILVTIITVGLAMALINRVPQLRAIVDPSRPA